MMLPTYYLGTFPIYIRGLARWNVRIFYQSLEVFMIQRSEYRCSNCGHEWSSPDSELHCYKCNSLSITRNGSPVEHKPSTPLWVKAIKPVAKPMLEGFHKLDQKSARFWGKYWKDDEEK